MRNTIHTLSYYGVFCVKVTLSIIKADVGGWVGHSACHPQLLGRARALLAEAKGAGLLLDFHVASCGDDLELILSHARGCEAREVHELAFNVFRECTGVAKGLKLYAAGQDLLSDAFTGALHGLGPGFAEIEFEERKSEPVLVVMADKAAAGAWNLPLFKAFADAFNTPGLVIDPALHDGFIFDVLDARDNRVFSIPTPQGIYDLLALIGATGDYLVKAVRRKDGEVVAVTTVQQLNKLAGRYVGKDDPACIIRCQSGLPAVGEVLEAFAFPHLVAGWMRGSHAGPLMPCAVADATPSRFDGPPRAVCLGFQLADGLLGEPRDMFADKAFDSVRAECLRACEYMRRHGPFEPHRLSPEHMEYTTLPQVLKKFAKTA